MATSATSGPNFVFSAPLSDRFNESIERTASSVSNKSIENPLLSRDPPALIDPISNEGNHLRHRRRGGNGVTFADHNSDDGKVDYLRPNAASSPFLQNGRTAPLQQTRAFGMPPPPRASISLGTTMDGPVGVPPSSSSFSSYSSLRPVSVISVRH